MEFAIRMAEIASSAIATSPRSSMLPEAAARYKGPKIAPRQA
jgi:hypothetical protein